MQPLLAANRTFISFLLKHLVLTSCFMEKYISGEYSGWWKWKSERRRDNARTREYYGVRDTGSECS